MTQPALARSATSATTEVAAGVAVVTIDAIAAIDEPDRDGSANRMSSALLHDLTAALDRAFADPDVRAIVLTSGKRGSFLVGSSACPARRGRRGRASRTLFAGDAEDAAREVAGRFSLLRRAPKPVVAWVRGAALGAGFELALACTAAIAADEAGTVLGFPDVELGLVPAANGLLRVAERAGLRVALEMGLGGEALPGAKALRLGLVDEVAAPDVGLDVAKALALRLAADPRLAQRLATQRRGTSGARLVRLLSEQNPIGRALLFRRLRRETLRRTRGLYPAPSLILDLVERFGARGPRSAADLEPRLFGDLAVGETAHRLLDLSFAEASLQEENGLAPGESAHPGVVGVAGVVGVVGIVGPGPFGARVGAASAEAGVGVRRRAEQVGSAELIVESVADVLPAKQESLREIERFAREDSVIVCTTSTLSVAQIAEAATHRSRVVGMHEGLVRNTALVEVVRPRAAGPRAVVTAVAFAKRLGKTVIVVRDAPLFYTPRILVPYLSEAFHLVVEGASIDTVDGAMLDWGFRTGPFQLLAELGSALTGRLRRTAEAAFGARLGIARTFPTLAKIDRERRIRGRPLAFTREEVALRCSLAMLNEVLRCHAEEVVQSARDADVAAVLGAGFPAFRGGPLRYVDVLGAVEVLRRTRMLEQRFGARFSPAPLLVEIARGGKRFYD